MARVAAGLGGVAVSGICETLSRDFKNWCSGMPDLTIWKRCSQICGISEGNFQAENNDAQIQDCTITSEKVLEKDSSYNLVGWKIKLVEVKGPRDTLMDKQRAWIDRLLSLGVQVEVCRVVEPELGFNFTSREKKSNKENEKGSVVC